MDDKKIFLWDRDQLHQLFRGRRGQEFLQRNNYETVEKLFQALISEKSHWSEYIIGVSGVGKTTFALQLWAQEITKKNILDILTSKSNKVIFITCEVEDNIAQNAAHITLLHIDSKRLELQKIWRDDDIRGWLSATSFGRKPGTTAQATTDDSITIARLKTDYEQKSRIIVYKSKDPTNRQEKEIIPFSDLSDDIKYSKQWVVCTSGNFSPKHIAHGRQLQEVQNLAVEKKIPSFVILWKSPWKDYDVGFTLEERIEIMKLDICWSLQYLSQGIPKFIKDTEGKVIKIIPQESLVILGKDRLPIWFTQWSYEEIKNTYPDFFSSKKKAGVVKKFEWYNFVRADDVFLEWSEDIPLSSTFIRKALIEGHTESVSPYLTPNVLAFLTQPHNLQALQRRYALIQERNQKIEERLDELNREYKQRHPITLQPLQTKKWEPAFLSKRDANACDNRRDQAKIMTYLQSVERLSSSEEKKIKKHYAKLISAQKLNFEK